MWCRDCHREVDVQTAGSTGAACPLCGRTLIVHARQTDAVRQAREILERWQSTDLFERISSTGPLTSLKQQDRAPLLSIPLGPTAVASKPIIPTIPVSSPSPPTQIDAPKSDVPMAAAGASDQQSMSFLESLIAPRPLLATAAPPLDEGETEQAKPVVSSPLETVELEVAESPIPSASQPAVPPEPEALAEPVHRPAIEAASVEPAIVEAKSVEATPLNPKSERSGSDLSTDGGKTPVVSQPRNGLTVALENLAAEFPLAAETLQASLPVLLAPVSTREEPASPVSESADSANDTKHPEVAATKKNKREPMRRPPLHRRFQLQRPVEDSSAGSNAVTRKLRLDQPGGSAETPQSNEQEIVASSVAPETKIVSNSPKSSRRVRIDSAETIDQIMGTDGRRTRTQSLPKHRYIDDAHESQLRGPHFEVTTPRRSNLTSMTGQFLAYLGVLGLTIGTAMVIYGHFGGYSEYTPTGWLVTTVAQMLLFLGVINLVSGGIEQNNDDVSRRINTIGDQLLRIEQVTSEVLRGPKLSARLYDDPNADTEESSREKATVERQ